MRYINQKFSNFSASRLSLGVLGAALSLALGMGLLAPVVANAAVPCPPNPPKPALSATTLTGATSFYFSAAAGATTTITQLSQSALNLRNVGEYNSVLNWSAISNQPWLTFSTASGSLKANTGVQITLVANPTGLVAGTYNAIATISGTNASGTNASGSPQSFPVTFTIRVPVPPSTSTGWSGLFTAPTGR
jgi:hypothetical protein